MPDALNIQAPTDAHVGAVDPHGDRANATVQINSHAANVFGHGNPVYYQSITTGSANYSTNSVTFVNVDSTNLVFNITTRGGPVLIWFGATASLPSGNTNMLCVDVAVDGTRLGPVDGLVSRHFFDSQGPIGFVVLKALAAGAHSFALQWKSRAGNVVNLLLTAPANAVTFGVMEMIL